MVSWVESSRRLHSMHTCTVLSAADCSELKVTVSAAATVTGTPRTQSVQDTAHDIRRSHAVRSGTHRRQFRRRAMAPRLHLTQQLDASQAARRAAIGNPASIRRALRGCEAWAMKPGTNNGDVLLRNRSSGTSRARFLIARDESFAISRNAVSVP